MSLVKNEGTKSNGIVGGETKLEACLYVLFGFFGLGFVYFGILFKILCNMDELFNLHFKQLVILFLMKGEVLVW